jgi:prepilin-type N-terminal cleavage/methylation domain-containing protein
MLYPRNLQAGFTLIELMIVMSIVALLMSLVGPLTIKSYEKAKAVEESLSFKNWVIANSYRSFATGREGEFTLKKSSATFSLQTQDGYTKRLAVDQLDDDNSLLELSGVNEADVLSIANYEFLSFEPQKIRVNSYGIFMTSGVKILVSGKSKSIIIGSSTDE